MFGIWFDILSWRLKDNEDMHGLSFIGEESVVTEGFVE